MTNDLPGLGDGWEGHLCRGTHLSTTPLFVCQPLLSRQTPQLSIFCIGLYYFTCPSKLDKFTAFFWMENQTTDLGSNPVGLFRKYELK